MKLRDPIRVTLVNLDTEEGLLVLANPEQLTMLRTANFKRHRIPGLSHQPLQYVGSSNRRIRGLKFWVDAHVADEAGGAFDIDGFARFIESLTVPGTVGGEPAAAPPRCLLVWPNILRITGYVVSVETAYTQFASDGHPIQYTSTCDVEEVLVDRVTSGEIRRGT